MNEQAGGDRGLPSPEDLVPALVAIGARYDFDTFVVGVHLDFSASPEEKARLTRPFKEALGSMLEERLWPGRKADFLAPQLQVMIDAATGRVDVLPAPLFVAGRYRKYARDISSTHWKHMACGGRGCPQCGFKGFFAEGSVGETIGLPLRASAQGRAYFFHGMGREDVDARMLGTGRPFVVEIAAPVRRKLPLARLCEEINAAGRGIVDVVGPLALVEGALVARVKSAQAEKTYHVVVVAASPLPPDTARRVGSLAGVRVAQNTPCRVRHRRARLERRRRVMTSMATVLDARSFLWDVRTDSGMYIKELATGDGGRTVPSLTELLDVPLVVADLDVTAVHWRFPWEPEPP